MKFSRDDYVIAVDYTDNERIAKIVSHEKNKKSIFSTVVMFLDNSEVGKYPHWDAERRIKLAEPHDIIEHMVECTE